MAFLSALNAEKVAVVMTAGDGEDGLAEEPGWFTLDARASVAIGLVAVAVVAVAVFSLFMLLIRHLRHHVVDDDNTLPHHEETHHQGDFSVKHRAKPDCLRQINSNPFIHSVLERGQTRMETAGYRPII